MRQHAAARAPQKRPDARWNATASALPLDCATMAASATQTSNPNPSQMASPRQSESADKIMTIAAVPSFYH